MSPYLETPSSTSRSKNGFSCYPAEGPTLSVGRGCYHAPRKNESRTSALILQALYTALHPWQAPMQLSQSSRLHQLLYCFRPLLLRQVRPSRGSCRISPNQALRWSVITLTHPLPHSTSLPFLPSPVWLPHPCTTNSVGSFQLWSRSYSSHQ